MRGACMGDEEEVVVRSSISSSTKQAGRQAGRTTKEEQQLGYGIACSNSGMGDAGIPAPDLLWTNYTKPRLGCLQYGRPT
jgi:hypothetical protein